jgi:hypothetical protein
MTTWQPKAVEAGCLAIADYYASKHEDAEAWSEIDEEDRQEFRAFVEAALRAALPLIEPSDETREAGANWTNYEGLDEKRDDIDRWVATRVFKAMLRACADEGKDQ